MKRLILALVLCCALPALALAGPVEDSVVRQLSQQGYSRIEISRTWLGRTRIVAQREDLRREIIINPATGEILRDLLRVRREQGERDILAPSVQNQAKNGGSQGGGSEEDDHDEDDDPDEDDDDDDDERDEDDDRDESDDRDEDDGDGDDRDDDGGGDDDGDDDDDD